MLTGEMWVRRPHRQSRYGLLGRQRKRSLSS